MKLSCPHMEEFHARSDEPGCAEEIVEKQVSFLRAFLDSSLEDLGKTKADAFWAHVRMIAYADPAFLSFDTMATFIVMRRL